MSQFLKEDIKQSEQCNSLELDKGKYNNKVIYPAILK